VQIRSQDAASLELSVSGYQFPDIVGHGEGDWDANWLRVHGTVTQADGKTWAFDDPCLTTWEAEALGTWLADVAAGIVPPSPFGTDEPEQILMFTEPNIAFSVEQRTADRVLVRVHLSLEALPPWLQGKNRFDMFGCFVVLNVSLAELGRAADDWKLELTRFPQRPSPSTPSQ
jgi:hypothetical protein